MNQNDFGFLKHSISGQNNNVPLCGFQTNVNNWTDTAVGVSHTIEAAPQYGEIYYKGPIADMSFVTSLSRENYILVGADSRTTTMTQDGIITYQDDYEKKIVVCKDRILALVGTNQFADVSLLDLFEKIAIEYQDRSPLELANALIDQCKYVSYVSSNCAIYYLDQKGRPIILSFYIGPSAQNNPGTIHCQFFSSVNATSFMGNSFCTTVMQNIQVPAPDFTLLEEQQIKKDAEWLHSTFDKIVEFSADVNMPSTVSKLGLMYLLDKNGTKKMIAS